MTTVEFSGILGLWLIGRVPSALALILPGIAVYFFAKRSGPAAGALSALLGLGLLSLVPILALTPMPKWWTVQWVSVNSAGLPSRGEPEVAYPPSASDRPLMAPVSLIQVAADHSAASLPAVPPSAPSPLFASRSSGPVLPWSVNWEQATRLTGILLVAGWSLALVRFVLGLRAVARFRAQSQEITDPMACDVARSIANQLGFPGPIRLRQSNGVASAATIGWMHPVILFPANWESWTPEELRVVLAHEIGHIVRRDYLAWVLAQFSLALHIYHPLAHWLVIRLRRDQELAADLLGSEVCGGRERYLITLSHLVLHQTSRAVPLFSRPMFSARGAFLWRMRMLNAGSFSGNAKLNRFTVSLVVLFSLVIGFAASGVGMTFGQQISQQPPKVPAGSPVVAGEGGILRGRIIAAETGKPVEGAKLLVRVQATPGYSERLKLPSDKEGYFSHDLPLGHCFLDGVECPPGYFMDIWQADAIALSRKEPLSVRNYSLLTGRQWQVEVAGYIGSTGKPLFIDGHFRPDNEPGRRLRGPALSAEANARGEATLTLPIVGGHCTLSCSDFEYPQRFEFPQVHLTWEEGFDPNQIQGEPEANATDRPLQLKDSAGKTATVIGAEVINRNGHAVLRYPYKVKPKSAGFTSDLIVQTEGGEPIAGARVFAALCYDTEDDTSYMPRIGANSGEDGKVTIPEVVLDSEWYRKGQRIKFVTVKPGFAGAESKSLDVQDVQKSGVAHFGVVRLKASNQVKGKVVDGKGNPVQGAVVNCLANGGLHFMHLTCRTDQNGRFQMPDLSYGPTKIHAIYGMQFGVKEFHFDEKTEEVVLSLRPYSNKGKSASP